MHRCPPKNRWTPSSSSYRRQARWDGWTLTLYVAHEQDELPGTPNAGQTVCSAFDVSDPYVPAFIAQIPLGILTLPSGALRNKKSINLVYVRVGVKGQTA